MKESGEAEYRLGEWSEPKRGVTVPEGGEQCVVKIPRWYDGGRTIVVFCQKEGCGHQLIVFDRQETQDLVNGAGGEQLEEGIMRHILDLKAGFGGKSGKEESLLSRPGPAKRPAQTSSGSRSTRSTRSGSRGRSTSPRTIGAKSPTPGGSLFLPGAKARTPSTTEPSSETPGSSTPGSSPAETSKPTGGSDTPSFAERLARLRSTKTAGTQDEETS